MRTLTGERRNADGWIRALLSELGRRKVFQVAAMYAVSSWLIIQVVGAVSEPLRLPEWLAATVIVLLGAGFPIALIFAWAFDLTPTGIEAAPAHRRSEVTAPKLTYFTHGLVLVAVGFLLADQYLLAPRIGGPAASGTGAENVTSLSTHPLRRYDLGLNLAGTIGNTGLSAHLTLSRDGTRLVYAANRDGVSRLYVRYLDQIGEQALAGTEGAQQPFLSPDEEWVAYFSDDTVRKLMKVALRGGRPQIVADTRYSGSGSWRLPGTIVFGGGDEDVGRNLYRVSAAGGARVPLLASTENAGYVQPDILPGGAAVLFTVRPGNGGVGTADAADIAVLPFGDGEPRRLVARAHTPRYAPTGHIVFVREQTLWAVPFDVERLETTGPEVPVVAGVQEDRIRGGAAFAFSSDGLLAYVPADEIEAPPTRSIPIWVDRDGREASLGIEPEDFGGGALSPDGAKLTLTREIAGSTDIWVRDLARGIWSRLTFDAAHDFHPIWSPDGTRVYFGSEEDDGRVEIRAVDAVGTNPPERVTSSSTWIVPESVTPDSRQLLVSHVVEQFDIESLTIPAGTTTALLATPFHEQDARISYDGRWLAYSANETGIFQVYVRPFPNVQDDRSPISTSGGEDPSWDPDGRALYYCGDAGLMAVSLDQPEPVFASVVPTLLISTAGTDRQCGSQTPDGQRFLMTKIIDAPPQDDSPVTPPKMIFVEHWFDELVRLAPRASGNDL